MAPGESAPRCSSSATTHQCNVPTWPLTGRFRASIFGRSVKRNSFALVLVVGLGVVFCPPQARGDKPPAPSVPAPQGDDATARGRAAYQRGVALSKEQRWGDALSALQEAAAARDAPQVEFAIGYCERALGRAVAARRTFQGVVASPGTLDASQLEDAKGYLGDLDKIVARVSVHVDPKEATLTVDGRPLAPGETPDTLLGGVAPAGVGEAFGRDGATIILDPGAHLFRAVRPGHEDAIVSKSYRPGETAPLDLHLDVLPATVAILSEPASAIVKVDAREVGVAPLEFQRPAGEYKLEVLLDRYDTYKATLHLAPGQRADLTAKLNPYKTPLVKRWWFWTGVAAVVAGGVITTYFLTRPAAQPPAYDSGSANWLVHAEGVRF
jgi:hypothetical protein